jgi:hypothetical protein
VADGDGARGRRDVAEQLCDKADEKVGALAGILGSLTDPDRVGHTRDLFVCIVLQVMCGVVPRTSSVTMSQASEMVRLDLTARGMAGGGSCQPTANGRDQVFTCRYHHCDQQ